VRLIFLCQAWISFVLLIVSLPLAKLRRHCSSISGVIFFFFFFGLSASFQFDWLMSVAMLDYYEILTVLVDMVI
jgi:hypothetical protein